MDQLTANPPQQQPPLAQPLAASLAVMAGVMRLLPHPWNMTPVGALGLFGGSRLRSWHAFALPLLVMLVTDALLKVPLALQGHPTVSWVTPFIYASFLGNVLIGRWLCRTLSPLRIGGGAVLCSLQFFVVTNFAVWLLNGEINYPLTLAGLVQCYTLALPFFGGTLAGDLLYTALFFGLYALLLRIADRRQGRLVS